MEDICPYCEKVTNLEFIKRQGSITIKGKPIDVEDQFFRCIECGKDFDDPKSTYDVLEIAYKKSNPNNPYIKRIVLPSRICPDDLPGEVMEWLDGKEWPILEIPIDKD
jgi:hypothetical protein